MPTAVKTLTADQGLLISWTPTGDSTTLQGHQVLCAPGPAAPATAAYDICGAAPPDVIILDWEMPLLNGPELVRIVRSPGVFPVPDVPIIMLSGHGERWRIVESVKIGVNEFLCKPVSAKALFDRLVSILLNPRETVQFEGYYGPAPRLSAPTDNPAKRRAI